MSEDALALFPATEQLNWGQPLLLCADFDSRSTVFISAVLQAPRTSHGRMRRSIIVSTGGTEQNVSPRNLKVSLSCCCGKTLEELVLQAPR